MVYYKTKLISHIITFILIVAFISCRKPTKNSESKIIGIPVMVEPLILTSFDIDYYSIGRVESDKQSNLFFQSTGKVTEVFVNEGDFVEEGQVLATVESDVYISAFTQAKSVYEKAKKDLESSKLLYESKVISSDQFENTQIALDNARSLFSQANNAMNNAKLTAPYSGWIITRDINIGDITLAMQQPPFILADMGMLKVVIPVPEAIIGRIKNGMLAELKLKTFPNRILKGKVTQLGLAPINASNYYNIEVDILGNVDDLKLGLIVNVRIIINTIHDAIVLPINIIRDDGESQFVSVAQDEKGRRVNVEIQSISESNALLSGDLYPGDLIITKGHHDVKTGTQLDIILEDN